MAEAGAGRTAPPRSGALLLLAVALLVAVLAWGFTASAYFYADDWLNFRQARDMGFAELARTPIFSNFSPGHRALDVLLTGVSDASWDLARGILLGFHLAAVPVCAALARELGMRWRTALAVAALFAASVTLGRALQWWASGAHILPSTFFTLVTLWAGVRWLRTRSAPLLAVAFAGQAIALVFYSKPVLCGLYLASLQALVLSGGQDLTERVRGLWRALPLWAALGAPLLAYVAIITGPAYGLPEGEAGPGTWIEFAVNTWLRGIAPSVIGQNVPGDPTALNLAAVGAGQVILLGFALATVVRRPAAWRAWAFFAVAAAFNVLILGIGRLTLYGPTVGQDLRYLAEFGFLFPLAAGLAVDAPTGEHRAPALQRAQTALRRLAPRGRAAVAAALLAVAAYAASYVGTLERVSAAWEGNGGDEIVDRLRADVARWRAQGREPVLVEARAPSELVAGTAPPFDALSVVIGEVDPSLPFDRPAPDLATMAPDGSLRPARPEPAAAAAPGDPELTAPPGAGRDGAALCAAGPGAFEWRAPAGPAQEATAVEIEIEPRPGATTTLSLWLDRGGGYGAIPDRDVVLGPGESESIAGLTNPGVRAVRLTVAPGGAGCLRRVALVRFP